MKIQILMSTYNGEKYIRTQLDSIAAQTIKEKKLLIRDDGSTDRTQEIIQEYQKRYSWISYYRGKNIGVQKSFLELIKNSDANADYIALADQDDEWLPEKLEKAAECLDKLNADKEKEIPLLYCSDKIIVDQNLKPIHVTVSRPVRKISFGNALVQDICTGCTAVFNQSLSELIRTHMPERADAVIMHDWWLYLTASCFGKVIYDRNPYIKYRQHGKNASGAMLNKKELWRYRLIQLKKPRGEIYRQVYEFKTCYADILNHSEYLDKAIAIQQLLEAKKSFKGRLKLAFNGQLFRQKRSDDFVFRGIILIGKL